MKPLHMTPILQIIKILLLWVHHPIITLDRFLFRPRFGFRNLVFLLFFLMIMVLLWLQIEFILCCIYAFALGFTSFWMGVWRTFVFFHFGWGSSHWHQNFYFFITSLRLFSAIYIFMGFDFCFHGWVSVILMSAHKLHPIFSTTMIRVFFALIMRFIIDFLFANLFSFFYDSYMFNILDMCCFGMMSIFCVLLTRFCILGFDNFLLFPAFLWRIIIVWKLQLAWLWQFIDYWLLWRHKLMGILELNWKLIRSTKLQVTRSVLLNIYQVMVIKACD